MIELMKRFHKNQKGFTLVELMVVVVIIGILVAIAIPIFNTVTDRANQRAVEANLRTLEGSIMQYLASGNAAPANAAAWETALTGDFIIWPVGPAGVFPYQVIGDGTTASPFRAQATGTPADSWWPADANQSLPITWP